MLLPDYPVPDLQRELEKLGFHRFFETTDSVKHRVSGPKGDLDVMIIALRAPADGPIGDSGLVVDDGETVCFNMNDARPVDLDVLHADFGHVDVHMLQYSGAIWYPMVYDMPARAKEAFGTQKRQRQMDRCRQYIASGRRDVGGPVGRPAVLPRSRTARPQRRPRRPCQHLPRPGGVPGPDAHTRPRRRPADDSRVDGRFHWARS